jgi:hypothetical protein
MPRAAISGDRSSRPSSSTRRGCCRHRIGLDNLLWGNDFPHGDGVWPDSLPELERQFARVPEAWRRAITCENTARLYGFPLPPQAAPEPREGPLQR